jgi:hypothetical protein
VKKSLLEIYALAVCFSTIVCFVIALGIGVYDVVQIANPEFTLNSHEYSRHQSNDTFWDSRRYSWETREKERPRLPENELTKQREESYQQALRSEQRDAFQSLTQVAIVILIDVIVFMIHWRLARRARETTAST